MGKRRLFLAIELPPAAVTALEGLQDELRRAFPTARMANPAGLHLTVKFIGYAEDSDLPAINLAAEESAGMTKPFQLSISGLGGFPSITRPRVIWAGAQDGGESAVLSGILDKRLSKVGVKSETRPFKPHITLARINKPVFTPIELTSIAAEKSLNIGGAHAEKLVLFESCLRQTGAEYTVLDEFGFNA